MSSSQLTPAPAIIWRVAVPSPLRLLFDYLPPDGVLPAPEPGVRVIVPFGRQRLVAVLVEIGDRASVATNKLKPVHTVLDSDPVFPPALLRTLCWAADYYQHPIGDVFATALPGKLRQTDTSEATVTVWKATASADQDSLGRAHRQRALLQLLQQQGELTRGEIDAAGFSRAQLKALQEKGLVSSVSRKPQPAPPFASAGLGQQPPALNPEQEAAVAAIKAQAVGYRCFLLQGVTGSGKTEVYMRAMQEQLERGRQCLLLVPEIGLTPQTVSRFRKRFQCPTVVLHSGLSDGERAQAWNQAGSGAAGIVIGTRSAVFTPLRQPGMIVIDEEHDPSFKQQEGFRYSARDLAVMRAREEGVPILLGSATPSLESLHNVTGAKFQRLSLSQRAGGASQVTMQTIDIAKQTLDTGFSEQVLYRIQQHLDRGNQVLVFLNRRGFAPVLACQDCGWVAECRDCVANLTLHASPRALRCHHCGLVQAVPVRCDACQSRRLDSSGLGTQQLERFLKARFDGTAVLRLDRDSTRSRRRMEAMLEQIHQGEPCILLGTQLLAKGHHFPHITLVTILDADAGLFSADFRGQEHMVQTVLQVAGRAGRAEQTGEVLVQSRHAAHPLLQLLASEPYQALAQALLDERQAAAMPPFTHLAMFRANHTSLQPALAFLEEVARRVREHIAEGGLPIDCLGPMPAPMEKRAGRFRAQLLLKSRSRAALQGLLRLLCSEIDSHKLAGNVRWGLDVDPLDFI